MKQNNHKKKITKKSSQKNNITPIQTIKPKSQKQVSSQNIKKNQIKGSKGKKIATMSQRLKAMMLVFFCILLLLIGRLGWLQIVQGAELKEAMYNQLTTNRIISPKRGTIYDTTGKALARSAQVDTVSINPTKIVVTNKDEEVAQVKTKALKEKVAKTLADIFELDYDETLEKVSSDKSVQTIARKVEKDKVDELREWMKENKVYAGINIDEDTKRYYPYDNLASNLIGFCGTDNQGLEGIEAKWDSVLTGTPGKITSSQDAVQDLIPDQKQMYIAAQNGNDITLTIDVNIQAIAEKYLEQACKETNCTQGGNVIIMKPSTGDILAMATYPNYNLNTPFTPTTIEEKEWNKLSSQEQSSTLQSIWNNKAITHTYEPGSVFKIITAAAGIEDNIIDVTKNNLFTCAGSQKVAGASISCSDKAGHGTIGLRDALKYSCNPAFIQLGKKIGASTLYRYYDAFGFFDTTNFASTGERKGYFWDLENVGEVELATMSFGQRFRVTPLQMITAVASAANDGILMQPRIVKEIKNSDTGAVTTLEPTSVRQVISKETAETLLDMLETVVSEGTGKNARVKGYSIAGKTGTSEPDPSDESKTYVASFVAISPVESPEVVVLLTLYGPQGKVHGGSVLAAPAVSLILSEVLPYLGIPTDTTVNNTQTNATNLPNVKNKTVAEAKKIIEKAGFTCKISGKADEIVTEQMPREGTMLLPEATVLLYTEGKDTRVSQKVPDLKGKSLNEAKAELKKKNLNIKASGSGVVISQDVAAESSVEEGTVISVSLRKKN